MKIKKIDMEKRSKDFYEKCNGNPLASLILSKQLWKIKCDNCGKVFECAENSDCYNKQMCSKCIIEG